MSSFLLELSAANPRPLKVKESDREPWASDTQAASAWFSEWYGYLQTLSPIESIERLELVQFIEDYIDARFEALKPDKGEEDSLMASVETKIKTLSAFVAHLSPSHLAKLAPPELKDLHNKVGKALSMHDEAKSAAKDPSKMNSREFESYRDRMLQAEGKV